MSTINNDKAYLQAVVCFMTYITGYKTKEDLDIEEVDSYLPVGHTTFIEHFVKEWGFDDEADALAFGAYMKEQYLLKNKKAFKGMPYPYGQILLDVLVAYDDDKTVSVHEDEDETKKFLLDFLDAYEMTEAKK